MQENNIKSGDIVEFHWRYSATTGVPFRREPGLNACPWFLHDPNVVYVNVKPNTWGFIVDNARVNDVEYVRLIYGMDIGWIPKFYVVKKV